MLRSNLGKDGKEVFPLFPNTAALDPTKLLKLRMLDEIPVKPQTFYRTDTEKFTVNRTRGQLTWDAIPARPGTIGRDPDISCAFN